MFTQRLAAACSVLFLSSISACADLDEPGEGEDLAEAESEIVVFGREKQGRSLLGAADPAFHPPAAPLPAGYQLHPNGLRTTSSWPALGTTINLTAGSIRYRATVESTDVFGRVRYQVGYSFDGVSFKPLCAQNDWAYAIMGPIKANGRHDLSTASVQFACRTGVAAKCVRFGYAPTEAGGDPRFFESCMRMLRADYCGNGRSYTIDGTTIGYFDSFGHAARYTPDDTEAPPAAPPGMSFEAGWRETGAVCLSKKRWQTLGLGGPCGTILVDPRQDPTARFCDDLLAGGAPGGATAPSTGSISLLMLSRINGDLYNESGINDRGLWNWGKVSGGRTLRLGVTSGFWGGATGAATEYPPEDFSYTRTPLYVGGLFAEPRTGTVPLYLYRHTDGRYITTSNGLLHVGWCLFGTCTLSPWRRVTTVGHVMNPANLFPAIPGLAGVRLYQYTNSAGDYAIARDGHPPAGFTTRGRFEGWAIVGAP